MLNATPIRELASNFIGLNVRIYNHSVTEMVCVCVCVFVCRDRCCMSKYCSIGKSISRQQQSFVLVSMSLN